MAWTEEPTDWAKPGRTQRGGEKESIVIQIRSLTAPGWVNYGTATTVLTATSVNPVLGSSTQNFSYRRSSGADLVAMRFRIAITTGGAWAAGTGAYRFLLPVAASAEAINAETGRCWVNDSGTAIVSGSIIIATSTHAELYVHSVTGNALGAAGPGTAWATGDSMRGSISYEPA
jgi:hypothetical protein